jgi:phosphoribosyl-AMP cyclohydrolase
LNDSHGNNPIIDSLTDPLVVDPLIDSLTDNVSWNPDGLVAAIAQDWQNGRVLMQAWMNAEALRQTVAGGEVVYWSRSRQRLWHKGESSGTHQRLHSIEIDCDGDALLLSVEQIGNIACHTGRNSCFYRRWHNNAWELVEPVLKDPDAMYGVDRE